MVITLVKTLHDLGFEKLNKFPGKEKNNIVKAVNNINFENYNIYAHKGNFEKALHKELGDSYEKDCKIF